MSVCCVWGVSLTHRMECLRGEKAKTFAPLWCGWETISMWRGSFWNSTSPGRCFENSLYSQIKTESSQCLLIRWGGDCAVPSITVPWAQPVPWACPWLHVRNVCELQCRFLVCCFSCFWGFFPISESTIEHRISSAGRLGSVLPLGLSGVLHFACNSAPLLFATCKCSADFWKYTLNLHLEAEFSYTFFLFFF